ncbi:MAG: S-layer homology domain-containing protein [Clostridia bacterium]|nr:S-layer homology domain-containing protein [Clostridia bacterium]
MKKLICLIVSLTLLVPQIAVYAQDDTKEDLTYLALLPTLGIISESEYTMTEAITRAEFLRWVLRASNIEIDATAECRAFSDVTQRHALYKEIAFAYRQGIISGDGGGRFYPEDYITRTEAVIMAANMLGYAQMTSAITYPTLAAQLSLTDGVKSGADEPLLRTDAAKIIFNTLLAPICDIGPGDSFLTFTIGERSLLEANYGIKQVRGVIVSSRIFSLYGYPQSGDEIILDVTDDKDADDMTLGVMTFLVNKYFAMEVECFYFYQDENKTIAFAYPTKRNTVNSCYGNDYIGFENMALEFKQDNLTTRSYKIDRYTAVIYNGIPLASFEFNEKLSAAAKITLIDNDADNKYDAVIAVSPQVYSQTYIDTEQMMLFGENMPDVDIEQYNAYVVYDAEGNETSITAVEAGAKLMVCLPEREEYSIYIYMAQAPVAASITELDSDSETLSLSNGETHLVMKTARMAFGELEIGVEYDFYMDSDGLIVDAVVKTRSANMPLYIMDLKKDQFGDVRGKFFASNGKTAIYEFADKLRLRGSDGNEYSAMKEEAVYNFLCTDSEVERQLIFATLNARDEINRIIMITEDTTKPYHLQDYEKSEEGRRWLSGNQSLENQIQLKSTTVIFMVPYPHLKNQQETSYKIGSTGQFTNNSVYHINESAQYGEDAYGHLLYKGKPVVAEAGSLAADYFVLEGPEEKFLETVSLRYGMVTDIHEAYDEKEEEVLQKITIYDNNGAKLELLYQDDENPLDLGTGDFIQIRETGKNITAEDIVLYYDRSENKTYYWTIWDDGIPYGAEIGWRYYTIRITKGTVLEIVDGYAKCETNRNDDDVFIKEYIPISGATLLRYSSRTGKYTTHNVSQLKEGDEFFAVMNTGVFKMIVLYDEE